MAVIKIKDMPVKQRKAAIGYESDTPVCENCAHYTKPTIKLHDGMPVKKSGRCKRYAFEVAPKACCDRWTGKKGEALE